MMKILSFGVTEILPSLLDKSKIQTIRPAWKRGVYGIKVKDNYTKEDCQDYPKPPRFKVGEEIQIYWKQRTKHRWFCKVCGMAATRVKNPCNCTDDMDSIFHKKLGIVDITDVLKIQMKKTNQIPWIFVLTPDNQWQSILALRTEEIAKWDGFKDSEVMFKYFDENYDLSSPKQFWVYRWKWF